MLLSTIAQNLGLEFAGDDLEITGVNTLDDALETELSFLANPKYASKLAETNAGAVVCTADQVVNVQRALISENPYFDFARCVAMFAKPQGEMKGISELAFIDPTAIIADNVTVYPHVFVGPRATIGSGTVLFPGCYVGEDSTVGSDCILYPNVVLMAETTLGDDCIIHAGVVLGGDGFGFAPTEFGVQKIPQIGNVTIGNDVEIGANTTIDRAVLGSTSVGDATKIDNLVMLGHNVEMGSNCLIVSQVGISGSTKVGNGVVMAGQAGIAGHLTIGDGATVGPKTGVGKDIPAGVTMAGMPAMEKGIFMRHTTLSPKIPDLFKRVKQLEKEIEALKK
ncbi:UDP-3-O-(3-hydroxymyristoyl)glucosamine N-acyltransferase [Halodesulfovibrio aestuarii]|uniref:UDP-3-O-acylglucosamine N-acyltransferase n=1 Tax=Halodesulfovibrio aestuarii TaxID=126333 RepID=A0ABV4JT39_9BACT